MKLEELWAKIVEEGKLAEATFFSIVNWSLENKVEENFGDFVSAIREELTVEENVTPKVRVVKLEHSDFLIYLANSYVKKKMFDKAIRIFSEMQKRGSTESTMLNDTELQY